MAAIDFSMRALPLAATPRDSAEASATWVELAATSLAETVVCSMPSAARSMYSPRARPRSTTSASSFLRRAAAEVSVPAEPCTPLMISRRLCSVASRERAMSPSSSPRRVSGWASSCPSATRASTALMSAMPRVSDGMTCSSTSASTMMPATLAPIAIMLRRRPSAWLASKVTFIEATSFGRSSPSGRMMLLCTRGHFSLRTARTAARSSLA